MHVVATAGHVDHGKSTLVKALTGTEPDRLAEERRRGLSIQLGYAWTTLPEVGDVAFVDVPGHERFLRTMLSGVGAVPAVLLVVAADDPWMPQAAEHLAALDALGVRHGVVAVSRCDLADPAPMMARARKEVDRTSLRGAPVVAVSGVSGQGLSELRRELVELVQGLPAPRPDDDVRLWVDRVFHVKGAGTVVTGTLPRGTVRVGDRLTTAEGGFRVRGVQALGATVDAVEGVARVALNVAPEGRAEVRRDSVLVTPEAWHFTDTVDVRLTDPGASGPAGATDPPVHPMLHVGAASVAARWRGFPGDSGEPTGRLRLERPLPLRIGDRAVLRDPGSRRLWGVTVLDPAPPRLRRRGAAARRATQLADHDGTPDVAAEVERRGVVSAGWLRRLGAPLDEAWRSRATREGWLVGDRARALLQDRLEEVVRRHDEARPLDPGMPLTAVAEALRLPSPDLVPGLVTPPLRITGGKVTSVVPRAGLPPALEQAVAAVERDLAGAPFAAPTADRLTELGLRRTEVATAARAGRLLHVGEGIVLLPDAADRATEQLRDLPQPFTTSQARQHLGTTRRVALPLLAHLDREGRTVRHPDDRRSLAGD